MAESLFLTRVRAALRRDFGPVEIAVAGAGVAWFVLAGHLNSFEWFYGFTRTHETWQLDEVANGFFIATIGLGIVLYARSHRLKREVGRRIQAEFEAATLARHDPLTGIANRRLFDEELERCLGKAKRAGEAFAVLLVDLNRFKPVNDVHGHKIGDRLLVAVADRLKKLTRREDILARLGGDEFGFAVGSAGKETAVRFANRMIAALEEPFELGDVTLDIGASIGIALYPDDSTVADELIQRADMAMYRAKASTANAYAFFDPALDEALRERAVLETDLRKAIGTAAIVPYYQPLVDLAHGNTFGFEVLARWKHPTRGMLEPAAFIPLAEDLRLIGDLMLGLLQQAVSDARDWDPRLVLSINLAPEQFQDKRLTEKIFAVLAAAEFRPSRLEVELTETALVTDLEAAKDAIVLLKNAGVRVAIDDFGKGYSSLYYLRELPFDVVKIDQSFVGSHRDSPQSSKIVAAVISLGEAMGLTTVAEGIEHSADAEWLMEHGCSAGQGFLYSGPVPAVDVPDLLTLHKPAARRTAA